MAAISGFMLWMMKEPEAAKRLGLIVASIIAVFVFGREYAESTAKNILALPVSREFFVLAKTVVVGTWFLALAAMDFCCSILAAWVPWCVVGIYSGAAGERVEVGWSSYAVLVATFLIGTGLTLRHELFADNVQ